MSKINRELPGGLDASSDKGKAESVSDSTFPHERMVADHQRAIVRAAIDRLRPEDREVILLRNYELLTFVEIGQRTGRTPDAVRKQWARAIEHLQDELDWMQE